MLSSRWNHVKDPEARESLRLVEQALNQLGNAIGIDPLPSQQNPTAQLGIPITAPQPPLALAVSSVSGGVLVQITANPANNRPVNALFYFVESSGSASFTNVTVYNFGTTQSDTIAVGTATLFYRCRCKYLNSGFSGYIPFGNPTAVTGGSAALGSTTGSGAVVLQTSPTIVTPTVNTSLTLGSNATIQGGGATMGMTQKAGDANGNYTTTSATFVDVDATNLAYTVTIPSGWKLHITTSFSANASAGQNCFVDLFDGATSILGGYFTNGSFGMQSLCAVVNGDGASHTIKLRFRTDGVNTLTIANNTANGDPQVPHMLFMLMPSN